MKYWACACEYAYSGLLVSEIKHIVAQESQALKSCGSVAGVNGVISGVAEGVGLQCPADKKTIEESQYVQKFLMPQLDYYAVATDYVRHHDCYNSPTGTCYAACLNYYGGGSVACQSEHPSANCDEVFKLFDPKVMARQPVLVNQALAACSTKGDGCAKNKDHPLVIDAYSQDALSILS